MSAVPDGVYEAVIGNINGRIEVLQAWLKAGGDPDATWLFAGLQHRPPRALQVESSFCGASPVVLLPPVVLAGAAGGVGFHSH